ncbi:MAG: SH3 domain-containing protein [Kiritimatiellia bacterium]
MARPTIRVPILAVFSLLACATCASAGELLAARYAIKPERPYVGQPFEIRLEIEVSPGLELQDIQLEGQQLETIAKIGTYQAEARRQVRRGDATVDLLAFVASGRALQPARQNLRSVLHAQLIERYSVGFFSSMRTTAASVRLDPLRLEFRPLPTDHVPPGFQGAMGLFNLTGIMDPARAAPGDIVTLTYTLNGRGWLGTAQLILPPPDPNFRVYPPQETQRDENGRLALRQVVVPLNTNATGIGVARFPYFDTDTGAYREAMAGPFALSLSTASVTSTVPAVRPIPFDPGPVTASEAGDAAVAATMSHARRLMPFAAMFMLALIVAGLLYGWRPRLAIAAGILLFVAGAYLCQHWRGQAQARGRAVHELTAARLCPSASSRVLFHIPPGRQVTPLEASEAWMRVDSDGQRGWIPSRVLKQ